MSVSAAGVYRAGHQHDSRKCLDHRIMVNEAALHRHLKLFLEYYHQSRTHWLEKDTPESRSVPSAESGRAVAGPQVGGPASSLSASSSVRLEGRGRLLSLDERFALFGCPAQSLTSKRRHSSSLPAEPAGPTGLSSTLQRGSCVDRSDLGGRLRLQSASQMFARTIGAGGVTGGGDHFREVLKFPGINEIHGGPRSFVSLPPPMEARTSGLGDDKSASPWPVRNGSGV